MQLIEISRFLIANTHATSYNKYWKKINISFRYFLNIVQSWIISLWISLVFISSQGHVGNYIAGRKSSYTRTVSGVRKCGARGHENFITLVHFSRSSAMPQGVRKSFLLGILSGRHYLGYKRGEASGKTISTC